MGRRLVLAATLSALAACTGDGAAAPARGGRLASQRVRGEYIVTLATGADAKAIEAAFGALGVRRIQDLGANMYLVVLAEDPGLERMEELRAKDERIRAVQPNFTYRAL